MSEQARIAGKMDLLCWILLAVVIFLAGKLCFNRIADPIGGFLGFNEANYILIAENFKNGSLLNPKPDSNLFLETPPLYPYLIYAFRWLANSPIPIARGISCLAHLGAALLVFLIGRLLFSSWAGVIAAGLYAFAPVNMVLGHNAQTDTLYLCLLLLAQWLYLRQSLQPPESKARGFIYAGAAYGAACFAKAFAWISLPAWFISEIWRHRGLTWLKSRNIWIGLLVALLIVVPFYLFHAVNNYQQLIDQMFHGAASATTFWSFFQTRIFLDEALWGYSPLITILFLVGLMWGISRRDWNYRFVTLQALIFLVFFLFVHKHSYYMSSLTPFLALLAGDALVQLRSKAIAAALAITATASGGILSLVMLCSVKYGFSEFTQIQKYTQQTCPYCAVLVREDFYSNYLRELQYYFSPERIFNLDRAEADANNKIKIASLNDRVLLYFVTSELSSGADFNVSRVQYSLVLFGVEIRESHPNFHSFRTGSFSFNKKHSWTTFGLWQTELKPSIAIIWLDKNQGIYKDPRGILVRD